MPLWDRRDFMAVAGAAAGTWPLATHAASPPRAPRFAMIVVDRRFTESHAFVANNGKFAERTVWIDGDITDLWYDELDLLWRHKRTALAGLTAYGAFFCLERLAWDRGLYVVLKQQRDANLRRGPASEVSKHAALISWMIAPKRTLPGGAA